MYYSAAIVAFFITSMAPTTSAGLSAEAIKEVIGDGCVNNIKYNSSFKTDTGDTCSTCTFCDGSDLSSLFDPTVENACVDCGEADNDCNNLEIVTDFEKPWLMNFITLTSSTMNADNDPFKIIIKASNDSNTWETINESDLVFVERKKEHIVFFNNNQKHKIYSILLRRKSTSTKIYLGQYGLVDSYTKACANNLYKGITGVNLLPHDTRYIEEPGDIILSKGNIINTITDPSNYFILSFKLYPLEMVTSWGAILRFTATSQDCCDYSDRWLLMNFRPNSYTMAFTAGSISDPSAGLNTNGVEGNMWNDIKVEAGEKVVKLYINGVVAGQLPNTDRPALEAVDVYASDIFSSSANAIIRDFTFTPVEAGDIDENKIPEHLSAVVETGDIVLLKGTKIDTINNPSNYFALSFKLYLWEIVNDAAEVLRFTATSHNCCDYSDRWLMMIFRPDSKEMAFAAGSTTDPNASVLTNAVKFKEWNDFKVVALGDIITLYINGVKEGQLPNTDRTLLEKLDVYAGSNHYPSANGVIRDYQFTPELIVSFRPQTIRPSKDNLIDTIANPPTQYIISFTLHPFQTSARANIIRFTSTTNHCCYNYGDRVPTIDFLDNTYDMLFVHGQKNDYNQNQSNIKGVVGNKDNKIKMVSSETGIVLYVNDQVRVTWLMGLHHRPQQDKFFVYASDKFGIPADAEISNFYFSHLTTA